MFCSLTIRLEQTRAHQEREKNTPSKKGEVPYLIATRRKNKNRKWHSSTGHGMGGLQKETHHYYISINEFDYRIRKRLSKILLRTGIPYSSSHFFSRRITGGEAGLGQQMISFNPWPRIHAQTRTTRLPTAPSTFQNQNEKNDA
jgi:hypothetical protein